MFETFIRLDLLHLIAVVVITCILCVTAGIVFEEFCNLIRHTVDRVTTHIIEKKEK